MKFFSFAVIFIITALITIIIPCELLTEYPQPAQTPAVKYEKLSEAEANLEILGFTFRLDLYAIEKISETIRAALSQNNNYLPHFIEAGMRVTRGCVWGTFCGEPEGFLFPKPLKNL